MSRARTNPRLKRESVRQALGFSALLLMVGIAVAGPSGIVAWQQNEQQLDQRRTELTQLSKERDELRNRVNLLDPAHPDADMATELVRSKLNVAGPDEKVMLLR